jgi:hypothetical protein
MDFLKAREQVVKKEVSKYKRKASFSLQLLPPVTSFAKP